MIGDGENQDLLPTWAIKEISKQYLDCQNHLMMMMV